MIKKLNINNSNNDSYKEEQIKITVSLGLIAFYTALIFGIYRIGNLNQIILEYIRLLVYGFWMISLIYLFLYILLTGAKFKHRERNFLDGIIPVGEKFRNFLYDEGIDMTFSGFINSLLFLICHKTQQMFNLNSKIFNILLMGFVFIIVGSLIYHLLYKVIKD